LALAPLVAVGLRRRWISRTLVGEENGFGHRAIRPVRFILGSSSERREADGQ